MHNANPSPRLTYSQTAFINTREAGVGRTSISSVSFCTNIFFPFSLIAALSCIPRLPRFLFCRGLIMASRISCVVLLLSSYNRKCRGTRTILERGGMRRRRWRREKLVKCCIASFPCSQVVLFSHLSIRIALRVCVCCLFCGVLLFLAPTCLFLLA